MSIYRSTGLVDFIASKGSVRQALNNCRVLVFGSTMPANADAGSGGIAPLVSIDADGGTYTAEIKPQWKFTLTVGTTGNTITSIKVAGIELLSATITFDTSLSVTATNIATAINAKSEVIDFTAEAVGAAVTITGPVGSGDSLNTASVVVTTATFTVVYNDGGGTGAVFTTGVAPTYGGTWSYSPTTGQISMAEATWNGVVTTAGTASWFMIVTDSDTGLASSTTARRVIGTAGTTGADLVFQTRVFELDTVATIKDWTLTVRQNG